MFLHLPFELVGALGAIALNLWRLAEWRRKRQRPKWAQSLTCWFRVLAALPWAGALALHFAGMLDISDVQTFFVFWALPRWLMAWWVPPLVIEPPASRTQIERAVAEPIAAMGAEAPE